MSIAAKCICSSSPYCDGREGCIQNLRVKEMPLVIKRKEDLTIEDYITRAIAMLKWEYQHNEITAGYNGIVSLLVEARILAQQKSIVMTDRKILKKERSKLCAYRSQLPILIHLSDISGDYFYTQEDIDNVDKEIAEIDIKIKTIDEANI